MIELTNKIKQLEAVVKILQSKVDARDLAITELEEQLAFEKKCHTAYQIRWLNAFDKFRAARDNAEATTVFREFLNEDWKFNPVTKLIKLEKELEGYKIAVGHFNSMLDEKDSQIRAFEAEEYNRQQ